MAGLCWMAVTLSVLLYAGSSFADGMSDDQLSEIVDKVWFGYKPSYPVYRLGKWLKQIEPMFSLAVSIPYNSESKKYDIDQVIKTTDPADGVKEKILNCEKHEGTRMVAATVLKWPEDCPDEPVQWRDVLTKCNNGKPMTWDDLNQKLMEINGVEESMRSADEKRCHCAVWDGRANHAEYRTLDVFNTLVNKKDENDFLLFYVEYSPCTGKCASETHEERILNMVRDITKWKNHAFVFSYVFDNPDERRNKKDNPETLKERRKALERLGQSVGDANIFRCDGECTRCFTGNGVHHRCISNKQPQH